MAHFRVQIKGEFPTDLAAGNWTVEADSKEDVVKYVRDMGYEPSLVEIKEVD